jgi:hypothetical protein
MADLMGDTDTTQIANITSIEILYIIKTIKNIQERLNDPDIVHLEYIRVYDTLGKEFEYFFNTYTNIFVKVIRGDNLSILASVLYYRDKHLKGEVTEEWLADKLAQTYFPEDLKKESDTQLKKLKEDNAFMQ